MNKYIKLTSAFLLMAVIFCISVPTETQACPKRFRAVKFIGRQVKRAIGAIGDGIHLGVREIKETIAEGKAEHFTSSSEESSTCNKYTSHLGSEQSF